MFWRLLRRFWNRRKEPKRIAIKLLVRAEDANGKRRELWSENVSDSGIRLRLNGSTLAQFVGHREAVPLEVCLEEDADPVRVHARLVWAYNTSDGGTVSGWQFGHFEGDARRRLDRHLDRAAARQNA